MASLDDKEDKTSLSQLFKIVTVSKTQNVNGNSSFECQISFANSIPSGYKFLGVSNISQASWGECLISEFNAQHATNYLYVAGKNVSSSTVSCNIKAQLIFVKSIFM